MSKTKTPMLDGLILTLGLLDIAYRRNHTKVRHTVTTRQIYDHKTGKIITLTTETRTITD